MWYFESSTGNWYDPAGAFFSMGYSGNGAGLNNPAMQNVPDVGPLPENIYDQSEWFDDPEKGPIVCRLIPRNESLMFGRAGMMNHGDNAKRNFSASEGCAIADHRTRLARSQSPDQVLCCVAIFRGVQPAAS